MNFNNTKPRRGAYAILLSLVFLLCLITAAYSQPEVEPWGNITGIRKDGQLFDFETFIKVDYGGRHMVSTGKEQQKPNYKRVSNQQVASSNIDSLYLIEAVTDGGNGKADVSMQISAHSDFPVKGVYWCMILHADDYSISQLKLDGGQNRALKNFRHIVISYDDIAKGFEIRTPYKQVKVSFDEPTNIMIKRDTSHGRDDLQIYAVIKQGSLHNGETIQKNFTIKAGGNIDRLPVILSLNTSIKGRAFQGLGGNFRLQNYKLDPQVIDYSLKNLRVAWGRVEMPWRNWQPAKDIDPIATADSGKLSGHVLSSMLMARRLDSLHIPIILSAWFPPQWAVNGKLNNGPVNGIWGNQLNKAVMNAIYKSIADYIIYLKRVYGVEPKLFSFNESDLGINVRLTAQEHDDLIKGCGAYFASRGLKTKMLLGDNSDATTYKFIYPALNDPAAKPYIGAISFHSWRGWQTETLQKWADAATKLNVPLLVGEGSIDAAAYTYPDIFQEERYALSEMNLYTRLLAICQPAAILQWQLTADYSPIIGGGIFGNNEPLHPGQRFWNLKQLSITPKGLFYMPLGVNRPNLTAAALGDNTKRSYAILLINNGASRKVILRGLPDSISQLSIYLTNKQHNMKVNGPVKVKNGQAAFKIPEASYVTLLTM